MPHIIAFFALRFSYCSWFYCFDLLSLFVGKYHCTVCREGVGSNSIACSQFKLSVYKKCCGISGQLVVNEDCLPQMHWIVAIYRRLPFTTFCYLGEILNVGGCCDSAIAARCCSVWCRFRKLLLGITLWYISFRIRGRVYSSCVLSTMLHGIEPWVRLPTYQICNYSNELTVQRSVGSAVLILVFMTQVHFLITRLV